ncbi:DNA-binding transcriptional MocR family regulator [Ochrobactrum daejeonense]|uniref:DNA-binding transcriptional MocR family regulator n=1 Tax=Brucella daejeonensis TaxID=659015 RepID=A0A7W9AUA9_9HYPH|nr:PLP-dependent aminotransferase family protein [Brucella daejeonensis]MBB5700566.1 DNA-binding transcriptional MocR family regulator [Brucella daejeonensis]
MISTGLLRSLEAVEAAYAGEGTGSAGESAGEKIPLVDKVMSIVRGRISAMSLAPGARLPSIRRLAETMNVSKSTVVEAYDRLVAEGIIQSRRGAGFYVSERVRQPLSLAAGTPHRERQIDPFWVMRQSLEADDGALKPGCGWLPDEWLPQDAIRRAMRTVARSETSNLATYGEPLGFRPLRQHLAHRLGEQGIDISSGEILLADSGTHAIDLICRYLLQPGDTVLVDDPCYFNFQAVLLTHRVKLVGIPYTPIGPDLETFARIAAEHAPKLYISNAGLHNPTGASMTPATAHRLLKLAETHGITLVEDNIFGDFHPSPAPLLAELDGFDRVLHIGSFSKTLSAAARIGYIAGRRDWIDGLTDLKLATSFGGNALSPQIVHVLLTDGTYRRHVESLRAKLADAMTLTANRLKAEGLTLWTEPQGGMFLWAELPAGLDSGRIARHALEKGVVLAPGDVFSPSRSAGSFLRFNVAQSLEPYIFAVLRDAMKAVRDQAAGV